MNQKALTLSGLFCVYKKKELSVISDSSFLIC